MIQVNPGQRKGLPLFASALRVGVIVGAVIMGAALLSMMTRMWTGLSYVWIANAVLLGLMTRFPGLANWAGWAGAGVGYILADLLMGAELAWTVSITTTNFLGVVAGYLLLRRLPSSILRLEQPVSIPWISAAAGVAAAVSALHRGLFPGGPAAQGFWQTSWTWFSFEFANYLIVLPLILALPAWRPDAWRAARQSRKLKPPKKLPGIALLLSFFLMHEMGGPVAVAYPVSALLWCAISYPIFLTTLLTTLFSFITLYLIWQGVMPGLEMEGATLQIALPVRVGVALIALGPIMVSSVMVARNRLLVRLTYLAEHDHLTGLYNRHAFTERAQRLLATLNKAGRHHAVMMMDIDHFKRINDTYGHQAGDTLLSSFARVVEGRLRKQDVLGRVGGEEFAVLLPDCGLAQAQAIAERIRAQVEQEDWVVGINQTQAVTVSIGVASVEASADMPLLTLLEQADEVLYEAKKQGRNRVSTRQL